MRFILPSGLLFLASGIAAFLLMDRSVNIYDEGIILTGAMRVLSGDLLHRDFYANYGPGQFYAVAALFRLFGADIAVERWWDIAVRSGIVALVYGMLAPRMRPWIAIAGTLACALWLWSVGSASYPVYPALLFSLAATLLLARSLATGSLTMALLAGVAVGVVTLFRYDVGFLALVGLGAGAIAAPWLAGRGSEFLLPRVKQVAALVASASFIVLCLLMVYAATGALAGFYHDVIGFSLNGYAKYRSLPFPSPFFWKESDRLDAISAYLPLACVAFALVVLVRRRQAAADPQEMARRNLLVLLLSLSLLFYMKGFVRISVYHVQLSLLVSLPLLAVACEVAWEGGRPLRAAGTAMLALQFASAAVVALLMANRETVFFHGAFAGAGSHIAVGATSNPDREAAIAFLSGHTSPGERIFVGTGRHDKIYINDVSAYFRAGRLPATHWHHFDPGLQTTAAVQDEIIRELETTRPRYVLVDSTYDTFMEPNESAVSSGVTHLDQYLASHYETAQSFGKLLVARRRS